MPLELKGRASKSKVTDIAGLLSGKSPEADTEPAKSRAVDAELADALSTPERARSEGESPQKTGPLTFESLAERLGVKVEDLYAIEFPAAEDGSRHTVGELKDMLAREGDFSTRELEFTERKAREENELMRARNQLQEILKGLPADSLSPETLRRAREELRITGERERAKVLEAIPEWADTEARESDMAGMSKHLEGYGFVRGDLDKVMDHRTLKMMRDHWQLSERVRAAVERARKSASAPSPAPRASAPAPQKTRAHLPPNANSKDKLAHITKLLQGV